MRNTRLGRDVRRDLLAREEEKVFEALFAANQNGKLFFCRAVTRKPSPTFFLAPFENVAVSSPQQSQLGSNAGSNPFKCSHLILPKIDSRFFPTTKYLSQSPFFIYFRFPRFLMLRCVFFSLINLFVPPIPRQEMYSGLSPPTEPFTILEPLNQLIDVSLLHKIRGSTDFDALSLQRGRPGSSPLLSIVIRMLISVACNPH